MHGFQPMRLAEAIMTGQTTVLAFHGCLGPLCLKRHARCMRRGRTGGMATVAVAAALHASAHVLAAVFSMVLLELGVETCIR